MKKGFTLVEIVVSLLIITVVAAVSAPVITKRMIRNSVVMTNNPWNWVSNSTFFNSENNAAAMIGLGEIPTDTSFRLLINSTNNTTNYIHFYKGGTNSGGLVVHKLHDEERMEPPEGVEYYGWDGIVAGPLLRITNNPFEEEDRISVDIGDVSKDSIISVNSIAIGDSTTKRSEGMAIGANTKAGFHQAVIGSDSKASRQGVGSMDPTVDSIIIGSDLNVPCFTSGIGRSIKSDLDEETHENDPYSRVYNSILIAHDVLIDDNNNTSVYWTDNTGTDHLVGYRNSVVFGTNAMSTLFLGNLAITGNLKASEVQAMNFLYYASVGEGCGPLLNSDLRLKNLGSIYTSGMDELNKLKFYKYTFKDDPENKRVGVIAQDLMKVFPNAVSKGRDGYYNIRYEDMFYAMVNAIRDFDKKLAQLIEDIKNPSEKRVELANKVSDLETEIKQQKKDIKILKRRIWFLKFRMLCMK